MPQLGSSNRGENRPPKRKLANPHAKAQSRHVPHQRTKAWPPKVLIISETVGRNQTGLSPRPRCLQGFNTEVTEMLRALRVEALTAPEYSKPLLLEMTG